MANDKVKKVKIEYSINVSAVEKGQKDLVRAIEKGAKDAEAAASKGAAAVERAYNRGAGIFVKMNNGQKTFDPLAAYYGPGGTGVLDAFTGVGPIRKANTAAKRKLKAAEKELKNAEDEIERLGAENLKLRVKRGKQRLAREKRDQARALQDEKDALAQEERYGNENLKLRIKRTKARNKAKETAQKTVDAENERWGKANLKLRNKRTKDRLKKEANDKKKTETDAEKWGRINLKLRVKRGKDAIKKTEQDKKRKEADRKRAKKAVEVEQRRQKAASQRRTNRFLGTSRAAASFAGAAIGSSLFSIGGGLLPGGFGAIPGLMASRAFGGAGLGASLGAIGGPAGMIAGGALGAGLGGVIGLFEGGIPAAINALTSGASTIVHLMYTGASRLMQAGAEYQRQITKFGILTGDKRSGRELYGGIESLSTTTPYSLGSLSGNAELLLGYGSKKDAIIPTLSRLGDIAGGDTIRLERLALAFGQVMSQGKLAGQELRQFSEAGVGINDFAITAGMSTSQFRSRMEQGAIPASVMVETINRLTGTGGRFHGMNQQISQTESGAWNVMMGTVDKFERRVGDFLNKRVDSAGILQSVTGWIEPASKQLESFIDNAVNWFERLGGALKGPAQYMADFGQSFSTSFGGSLPPVETVPAIAGRVAGNVTNDARTLFGIGNAMGLLPGMNSVTPFTDNLMPYGTKKEFFDTPDTTWEIIKDMTRLQRRSKMIPMSDSEVDAYNMQNFPVAFMNQQAQQAAADAANKRSISGLTMYGKTSLSEYGSAGSLNMANLSQYGVGDYKATSDGKIAVGDATYPEANKLAEHLNSQMASKGVSPLSEFSNTMRNLQIARFTPPGLNSGSLMGQKEYEFGRFEAFERLKKEMGDDRNQVRFASSSMYGSEHGTESVFGSLESQAKMDTPIMEILKEANERHKETKEELEKLNAFFENNRDAMKLFIEITDGAP